MRYRFWLYNAVAAEVPARLIKPLAKQSFVSYIYWDQPIPLEPKDFASSRNVRAHHVHIATPEGYTGEGVKIGVVGRGVKEDITWLQRDGQSVVVKEFDGAANTVTTGDAFAVDHETMIATVIAGQDPTHRGLHRGHIFTISYSVHPRSPRI